MAIALKSVWQNLKFQSAFKAVLFGLSLIYSFWLAAPVAVWFYFRPFFYSFVHLKLFLVFLILTGLTFAHFDGGGISWLAPIPVLGTVSGPAAAVFAGLFYLILGLKNLIFVKRRYWYLILNLSLLYLVFLNFFLIDQSTGFALKWLGFLALVYLLIRDLLIGPMGLVGPIGPVGPITVAAGVLTLIIGESLWLISWLPIGFLNSANLAALFLFLLMDLTINHFWGTLRRRLVLKDLGLFLGLLIVIFLTSKWGL